MIWEWVVIAIIVAILAVAAIIITYAWKRETAAGNRRLQLEIDREQQRQAHELQVIIELGRQMLGTLRPGETLEPASEEDVVSPVQGDAWWNDEADGIDPTDASLPDDLRVDPTEATDGGVENLG